MKKSLILISCLFILLPSMAYSQSANSSDPHVGMYEAKVSEMKNGTMVTKTYYFSTQEEAKYFEKVFSKESDTAQFHLEIIGQETIDGVTRLVTKLIPTTIIMDDTERPQKPVPEGYVPYTTPKIDPLLVEKIESGEERVDVQISLKNTPEFPSNFSQLPHEERMAIKQEMFRKTLEQQQDLVDFISANGGSSIQQIELTNSVRANIPYNLITDIGNRGDVLTVSHHDKSAKFHSLQNGNSVEKKENMTYSDVAFQVKLINNDKISEFEIIPIGVKSITIAVPNELVSEELTLFVNNLKTDFSVAKSDDKSILVLDVPNEKEDQHLTNLTIKQQIKQGVLPKDIKCKEDLKLIFKVNSQEPACVKPSTMSKLLLRGWIL